MKRYPEYKESGVEWIGEIPKHWEVERNKRIFNEKDDRSVTGKEELLTVSHITGVSPRAEKKNVGMFLAETLVGYKHCSVGNLVINTMWAWMGALGISAFDGIVSPSYNVYELKSSEYLPRYYDYLYRTPNHVNEIMRWSKGIWTSRWRLYPDAFFSMFTIIPPFREQTQIANFLDHKMGQIDELIRIKERRIELLEEQRTALINQVVTKGFDPNVEMKPSGVEWIGEIPAHWNLCMLKYASRLVYGDTLIAENRENGVVPVYGSNGIIDTHSSSNTLSPAIIVGRKGSLGKIQYSDVSCFVIDTAYYIDRRTSHVNLRWLYYILQSLKLERFRNSVLPGLNRESAEGQYVPLISAEEQTQIANFLDRKTQQIDELIATEQRKIELLKEYRQSLISEAVTGKIDVRNEV